MRHHSGCCCCPFFSKEKRTQRTIPLNFVFLVFWVNSSKNILWIRSLDPIVDEKLLSIPENVKENIKASIHRSQSYNWKTKVLVSNYRIFSIRMFSCTIISYKVKEQKRFLANKDCQDLVEYRSIICMVIFQAGKVFFLKWNFNQISSGKKKMNEEAWTCPNCKHEP